MAVQNFLRDLDGLFNYSTDENPTSQQDYQEAVKNWVDTIKSLVDCTLWQPDTEYSVGNVLRTPSLPYELQLTCITAGTSGSAEPDYTDVEAGDTITDGTVEWMVSSYLLNTNGTMMGDIISIANGPFVIKHSGQEQGVHIWAGENDNFDGATLQMFAPQHSTYAGQFWIRASSMTSLEDTDPTHTSFELTGRPNGNLTWGNKRLATYGVVDGHGIQTGSVNGGTVTAGGSATGTITFPTPFSGTPRVIVSQSSDYGLVYACCGEITTTGFRWRLNSARSSAVSNATVDWIAIY